MKDLDDVNEETVNSWLEDNADLFGIKTAGFFLNALYSVNMTWKELVVEWQAIGKNRHKLQVFKNRFKS